MPIFIILLHQLINKKAVLSQGELLDAGVNFDTYLATLLMRTHLAPKPAQNTLNHVYRSFKVTHFGITEKPMRACVLLHNNVGYKVGNFEGMVWASPFSRTSLSFGGPYLGNPCEYLHKPYISKTKITDPYFEAESMDLSSFIFFRRAP